MSARILSIILSSLLLVFIIDLVRREKLTFKYASGWMTVLAGAIFMAVFDSFLGSIARFFGFELASNFIFFVVLCGFVFLSLLLTLFLCQLNGRNEKLAQKIALLEHEVENLKRDSRK